MLIAQITDTHIMRDGAQARYLADVLTWINAMQPKPDAVLLSGDAVNDGKPEQYAVLRDLLGRSEPAVYVVPGNHDRRDALRATLDERYFPGVTGERLNFAIDTQPVRIIGLDTSQPNRLGGYLHAASLDWLDECLSAAPARPTFVFMHHPPFRTGVNAADLFGFTGLREFKRIVARHRAVRRIVAGHIHCERRADLAQALATTSISTAPQRIPELFERKIIGLRAEAPGFAIHAWSDDAFTSTTYVNAGNGHFIERGARIVHGGP